MTKKIFAMFLAVLMIVSVLPISAMAAGECPGKGKHTATNCNNTVVKVVEPTCGTNGYTTYKCSDCKEEFADNIVVATGEHDYVADAETAVEPTCGQPGYEAGFKCSVCEHVKKGAEIDPIHKAGIACEYEPTIEGIDCVTGGKQVYECVNCGHTYEKKLNPGSHNWKAPVIVKEATPAVPGEMQLTCKDCPAVKTVVLFDTHEHDFKVVEANVVPEGLECTVDTWRKHQECKVCGAWADLNGVVIDENLKTVDRWLIKAAHAPKDAVDCDDTTAECVYCGKEYDVTALAETKHSYYAEYMNKLDVEQPTCGTSVVWSAACVYCDKVVTVNKPALGHELVEYTTPATCGQYAYTFSYCVREGCNATLTNTLRVNIEKNKVINETTGLTEDEYVEFSFRVPTANYKKPTKFADNTAYKLVIARGEEGQFAFNGTISGNKLDVTTKAEEAIDIYFEYVVEFERPNKEKIMLYTLEDGVKKYFSVSEAWNGVNAYNMVYTFVADINLAQLVEIGENGEISFTAGTANRGTYGTYTFGYSTTTRVMTIAQGNTFAAKLQVLDANAPVAPAKVRVIAKTVKGAFDAGFDANNHSMVKVDEDSYNATCLEDGHVTKRCEYNCGHVITEVVVGKHKYEALTDTSLMTSADARRNPVNGKVEANCTTDGFKYTQCTYCGDVKREALAKTGHSFNYAKDPIVEFPSHLGHGQAYYVCENENCPATTNGGYKQIVKVLPWTYGKTVFNSYAEAKAAHGNVELTPVNTVAPTCNKAGYTLYTCDVAGCMAPDKIKVILPATHVIPERTDLYNVDDTNKLGSFVPTVGADNQIVVGTPVELTNGVEYVVVGTLPTYVKNGNDVTIALGLFLVKDGKYTDTGVVISNHNVFKLNTKNVTSAQYVILPKVCVLNDGSVVNNLPATFTAGEYTIGTKNANVITTVVGEDAYKAATCTEDGGYWGFKCANCKQTVGKLNQYTFVSKTEHSYTILVTPAVNNSNECGQAALLGRYACVCRDEANVYDFGTEASQSTVTIAASGKCNGYSFVLYTCSICDKEHAIDYVPAKAHDYIVKEFVEGTCYETGSIKYECKFCANKMTTAAPTVAHENKAGEKFFNSCIDEVTDRHCVVCCKHNGCDLKANHNCVTNKVNGKPAPCACVIKKDHNSGAVAKNMNSSCTMAPYSLIICEDCGEQEIKIATYKDANDVEHQYKASGHKPAQAKWVLDANGNKMFDVNDFDKDGDVSEYVYERRAGYVYVENFDWTSVTWNADAEKYEVETETYVAEMTAYEAASYAGNGTGEFYCQICEAEVEQTYAKFTGIGFELDAVNANGSNEFTRGSMLALTVSLNGDNAAMYGFNGNLYYNAAALKLVGAEMDADKFFVEHANDLNKVVLAGFGANTIDGKPANTVISEKTPVITLYFRVMTDEAAKINFTMGECFAYDKNYNPKTGKGIMAYEPNGLEDIDVKIRGVMDIDNNGYFQMSDLFTAMDIISGTVENRTYDVTMDADKDGELTLQDMMTAYKFFVDCQVNENEAMLELFLNGIDAQEIEDVWNDFFDLVEYECKNKFCDYASDELFKFCPTCGAQQYA